MLSENDLYGISVAVARSNPLILRMVHMRPDRTVAELVSLCCVALGLAPQKGECIWEEGDTLSEECLLSYFMEKDTSGRILLYGDKKKESLELILDVREAPGVGKQKNAKVGGESGEGKAISADETAKEKDDAGQETCVPYVSDAVGLNLPEECYDIAEVNRLQKVIDVGMQMKSGRFYLRGGLAFSAKRTENAIRKVFAPETAKREPNRGLALPRAAIYTTIKNNELKEIMDSYGIYRDSTMRKADMVESLSDYFNRGKIRTLLDQMEVGEYLDFKEFIYCTEEEIPNDYAMRLATFYDAGLISEVPKAGVRIASEVMEAYEEMVEKDEEEEWLEKKYMRTVINCCKKLYRFFTQDMFCAVLKVIAPKDFPFEKAERNFLDAPQSFGGLRALEGGYLYATDGESMHVTVMNNLKKSLPPEELGYYLPSKEEVYSIASEGVSLSAKGAAEIERLYKNGMYSSYYWDRFNVDASTRIARCLQVRGDVEAALQEFKDLWRRVCWGQPSAGVLKQAKEIIASEAKTLPLISHRGYSKSNAPAVMKKYLKEQEKKPAAKKTTAKRPGRPKKTAR